MNITTKYVVLVALVIVLSVLSGCSLRRDHPLNYNLQHADWIHINKLHVGNTLWCRTGDKVLDEMRTPTDFHSSPRGGAPDHIVMIHISEDVGSDYPRIYRYISATG